MALRPFAFTIRAKAVIGSGRAVTLPRSFIQHIGPDPAGFCPAQTGRQLRRLQTGYVRNYALGIGIGAAVILAYVATRVGS